MSQSYISYSIYISGEKSLRKKPDPSAPRFKHQTAMRNCMGKFSQQLHTIALPTWITWVGMYKSFVQWDADESSSTSLSWSKLFIFRMSKKDGWIFLQSVLGMSHNVKEANQSPVTSQDLAKHFCLCVSMFFVSRHSSRLSFGTSIRQVDSSSEKTRFSLWKLDEIGLATAG